MKNILIVSPFLPWPLNSGGNTGVYYMLEFVSKYKDVYFLTLYNKRYNNYEQLSGLKKQLPNVHFLMYDYRNTHFQKYEYLRKILRYFCGKVKFGDSNCAMNKMNLTESITPGLIRCVNDTIVSNAIDVVQIEFLGLHPLIYAIPKNIKKIFIHHELGWGRHELTNGKDIYSLFLNNFFKDSEIAILNKYDIVASLTEIDRCKLLDAGLTTNVCVSTLAISNCVMDFQNQMFSNRLTFIGGSGHYPNFDGIKWFVSNVLPIITLQNPNIKLEIIGAWDQNSQKEIHVLNSNVVFRGFVDDLNVGLQNSIMVVPINIGSGMRMKILEAANYSVPFVSTKIGVEGLDFENSKDCYIAEDAPDMANKILELANDENLYHQFSLNAHNVFERKYSINTLGKERLKLYE